MNAERLEELRKDLANYRDLGRQDYDDLLALLDEKLAQIKAGAVNTDTHRQFNPDTDTYKEPSKTITPDQIAFLKDKLQSWSDTMCLTSEDVADLLALLDERAEPEKPVPSAETTDGTLTFKMPQATTALPPDRKEMVMVAVPVTLPPTISISTPGPTPAQDDYSQPRSITTAPPAIPDTSYLNTGVPVKLLGDAPPAPGLSDGDPFDYLPEPDPIEVMESKAWEKWHEHDDE